ncbi:MAG: hypothetical protein ACTSRS_06205 [Candidatus Helarchaeota archaeon]
MGFLSDLIAKIKTFITDLRKHFGLLLIITLIWLMLLIGIVFLKVYIGPLEPDPGFVNFLQNLGFSSSAISLLTGFVQVTIAAIYVLLWLYLWHRLVRMYFWRTAKKYLIINENNQKEVNK